MDTRNTKRSKIELKASDNDNLGSRWKGSLPTEDLSDLGDEIWAGIVPQKTQRLQRTTPKVEKNDDYPFGSTRSNVKIEYTSSRVTFTLGPVFFKPASLRQEELHLKDKNSQMNGKFQWDQGQYSSSDKVKEVTSVKPFQNKMHFVNKMK